MGRKSLQVKGYSPESIKALFNSDDKYKIGLRLYAVYQVSLGQPSRKLEDLYNTSFKQITNWVHRFEQEGLDGCGINLGEAGNLVYLQISRTDYLHWL
jgi:hypothetical protein